MVAKYQPLRANIGKSRIPYTDESSVAQFTRSVRQQINGVINELTRWTDHMNDVSAEVLRDALEPSFEDSQMLVPEDTGALKASGYLETRQYRGNTVCEIGYGRNGVPPYAPIVHERVDMKHRSPTQAKFLQEPLENNSNQIRNDILAAYKEASGT